jgi:serine/threonine protein kinase
MNEETIVAAALNISDEAERAAFVECACAGRHQLLDRVRQLLEVNDQALAILRPHFAPNAGIGVFIDFDSKDSHGKEPPLEKPGTQIGRYKLLQQIGEGGFGVVFMAEQNEPVHRKVALKVIKPGKQYDQILARFEQERQVLALLDHPNIARFLDAGAINDGENQAARSAGRPYFVMELVHGVSITKYCDEHRVSVRERLQMFIPICEAVQHAHQKGIIHRDLKPSNVLVASYDGKPSPKIIDFGIAKAIGMKLTDKTLFTEFGALIGTPEYMSPEQAELN